MTIEHREAGDHVQPFPLQYNTTWETVDWMYENLDPKKSSDYHKTMDALWSGNEDYYDFAMFMRRLRFRKVQNSYIYERAYERGFQFASLAIQNHLKKLGDPIPESSLEIISNYFESLFVGEDSSDLDNLKKSLGYHSDLSLYPAIADLKVKPPIDAEIDRRLDETFVTNSDKHYKELCATEPSLTMHLRRPDFYSTFGPHWGLSRGVVDAYEIIRATDERARKLKKRDEEIALLERMWEIPINKELL